MPRPLVSALVSVYNCERFIAGCLDDLQRQTVADQVEIVVVNTGSEQDEKKIIRKYQERFDNIVYIETKNRETIYKAWNIGIAAAAGKYITNANADDRHREDAFEKMVQVLESDPSIDLVYSDTLVTERENDRMETCRPVGSYNQLGYVNRASLLLHGCYIGPQPMWRRDVHDRHGFFDEEFTVAGDYEFWCRMAQQHSFKHLPEFLGLYYHNPEGIVNRDEGRSGQESRMVKQKYKGNLPKPEKNLPTGFNEFVVHPGYVDEDLKRWSIYLYEREEELKMLLSEKFKAAILKSDIKLAGYRDIPC